MHNALGKCAGIDYGMYSAQNVALAVAAEDCDKNPPDTIRLFLVKIREAAIATSTYSGVNWLPVATHRGWARLVDRRYPLWDNLADRRNSWGGI